MGWENLLFLTEIAVARVCQYQLSLLFTCAIMRPVDNEFGGISRLRFRMRQTECLWGWQSYDELALRKVLASFRLQNCIAGYLCCRE